LTAENLTFAIKGEQYGHIHPDLDFAERRPFPTIVDRDPDIVERLELPLGRDAFSRSFLGE